MNIFLFCAFFGLSWAAESTPEVSTSLGKLRGTVLQSRNGRDFLAYTKIPFAKPPVGELRFKSPVSPEPWSGVLDASKQPPPCFQTTYIQPFGSEDCLYLNVYTPKTNGSYPVMIYFFGGGWRMGSTGPSSGARYFMDEDVVLVVPNYRLGAFGFLSTEDEKIPGNMGLKDMVAAIEWIKRDISNFGGDPNKITAFGTSAGAASAHYLCALPRSRALLKGCISHSGVGGSHWSLRKSGDAKKTALIVAKAVGCDFENILKCLQSKPAEEIIKTQEKLKFWIDEPLIIHGPVLEPKLDGALLTEWPVKDSNFPWLTGVTSREGLFKSIGLQRFKDKPILAEFLKKKEEYLTKMLNLPEDDKEAAQKVAEKFFSDDDVIKGMEKLLTEGYFEYPALHEIREHKGPKYFYVFNVTGGASIWEGIFRTKVTTINSGVAHGDDIPFFFDTNYIRGINKTVMSQPDNVKVSQQLIRIWVNFAKNQKPTAEGETPFWPEFNNNKYFYLSKENMEEREFTGLNEITNFWDNIYKISKN